MAGRCPAETDDAGTGKDKTDGARRGWRRERRGWDARHSEGGAGTAGARKGEAETACAEVDRAANARR